jgi:hypothetical protein
MLDSNQITDRAKALIRRSSRAYELVRRRRARRQEDEYVARRDHFARSSGPVFAAPGYRARSRERLGGSWNGPPRVHDDPKSVRVFAIVADDPGGPQLLRPLQTEFDTTLFDLARYRVLQQAQNENDQPVTASLGWRDSLQKDLVQAFESAHAEEPIDLVFAYASHYELEPRTLDRIRAQGVPVAVLCLDDKHVFAEDPSLGHPNGQEPLIGSVDVHLTNSIECVRWYLAKGVAAYYMPQGIDPTLYPPDEGEPLIDVSFMGQRYGMRGAFIDALRRSGVEVDCYGPGWGRVVSHDEKVRIYSRSRINLGIGGVGYSDRITCVKGREFEVAAAGGLYLTTYDPELPRLFEIGREILCYRNEIDCVELIRYYLENEQAAREIAAAGRQRCLKSHTWGARMAELLGWMGILREASDQPRLAV